MWVRGNGSNVQIVAAGGQADDIAAGWINFWFFPEGVGAEGKVTTQSANGCTGASVGSFLPSTVKQLCVAAIFAIGLMVSSASATRAASPQGIWLTANGHGVVQIAQCGDALCGQIVGIDREPTVPMPTDMRGRPQCGLTIIRNEKPEADGTWLGEITDPRDGSTYQARLWVDERGNLHLRAFLGTPVLGATVIWRPFTGHLTAKCGLT
jgi:uncharacterized protein (DUF2147 family)